MLVVCRAVSGVVRGSSWNPDATQLMALVMVVVIGGAIRFATSDL